MSFDTNNYLRFIFYAFYLIFFSHSLVAQDYYMGGKARQLNANLYTSASPHTNFTNTGSTNIYPSRNYNGCNCIELTPDQLEQQGRVYGLKKLDLTKDFSIEFDFYFGNKDAGADGMVFFIHNDSRGNSATGTFGEGLGYGPRVNNPDKISPSIAFEFDTYQNTNKNDPTADHLAFLMDGDNNHANYPAENLVSLANIEDNKLHRIRLEYVFASKEIRFYFDGLLKIAKNADLANHLLTNEAFWGLTAGTGAERNQQYICNPNGILTLINVKAEFDTNNLCQGQKLIVDTGLDPLANFTFSWRNAANPNVELGVGSLFTPQEDGSYFVIANQIAGLAPGCNFQTEAVLVSLEDNSPPANDLPVSVEPATVCNGASAQVRVANSQLNVNYQLVKVSTGLAIGNLVAGTGETIILSTGNLSTNTEFKIITSHTETGCSFELLQKVTVSVSSTIAPLSSFSGSTAVCLGNILILTADEPLNAVPIYTWFKGNTLIQSGHGTANRVLTIDNVSLESAGNYTLEVSRNACTSASNFTVTVNAAVDLNLNVSAVNPNVCIASGTQILVQNSQLGYKYQLRIGLSNVNLSGALKNGTGGDIVLETGAIQQNTTYNILVSSTACPPLQLIQTTTVNVSAAPNLGFTGNINLCEGQTLTLTATQTGATAYIWRKGLNIIGTSNILSIANVAYANSGNDYTLEINTGSCSAVSANFAITVGTTPLANLTVVGGSFCAGTNASIGINDSEVGVSYQALRNGVQIGTAVSGTGGNIVLIILATNLTIGNNIFSIRATRPGCGQLILTNTASIHIGNKPNNALGVLGNVVCKGQDGVITINASETGVNYQAYSANNPVGNIVAGGGNINLTVPTINLVLGANMFSIKAIRQGCVEATLLNQVTITANAPADTNLVVQGSTACLGEEATIQIQVSETYAVYQAFANGSLVGNPVNGGGNISLNIPAANLQIGDNIFKIKVIKTGCGADTLKNAATVSVLNQANLNLTVSAEDTIICFSTGTKVFIENSEPDVLYQLRNGTTNLGNTVQGNGSKLELATGIFNTTGTFVLNVLANRSSSCVAKQLTKTVQIKVTTAPNTDLAAIPADAELCAGNQGTIISVLNTEGDVLYQLRLGNANIGEALKGTGNKLEIPSGEINTLGLNIFTILATRGNCASKELLYPVYVQVVAPAKPDLPINPADSILCLDNNGTKIKISNSESNVLYQLKSGNQNIGEAIYGNGNTLELPTGVLNAIGEYKYQITAFRRSCGEILMQNEAKVKVYDEALSNLSLKIKDANLCLENQGTIIEIANSEKGVNYQLRMGNMAIGNPAIGNGAILELATGEIKQSGTVVFTILATRLPCGSVVLDNNVSVNIVNPPALNLNVQIENSALCSTNNGTFINISNSEEEVSYQLRIGEELIGNPLKGNKGTLRINTGSINRSGKITFNILAIKENCQSKQLQQTVDIFINPPPVLDLTISSNVSSLCTGNTGMDITLENSENGVVYQLFDGKFLTGATQIGAGGKLVFRTNPITVLGSNTFSIFATKQGCPAVELTKKVNITLNQQLNPTVRIEGQNKAICSGTGIMLKAIAVNGGENPHYQWKKNGQNVGVNTPVFTSDAKDKDEISVVMTSALPCTAPVSSGKVIVEINALPEVKITSETSKIGYGFETKLKASGAKTYTWEPKEAIKSMTTSGDEVIVSPEESTTFTVIGTDINGCVNTAKTDIKVESLSDIFIPSLFSPNSDTNNDTFLVHGKGISEITIRVFDRAGNLVYEATNLEEASSRGWDGTHRGIEQPAGKYIWYLSGKFKNGDDLKFQGKVNGQINLLR